MKTVQKLPLEKNKQGTNHPSGSQELLESQDVNEHKKQSDKSQKIILTLLQVCDSTVSVRDLGFVSRLKDEDSSLLSVSRVLFQIQVLEKKESCCSQGRLIFSIWDESFLSNWPNRNLSVLSWSLGMTVCPNVSGEVISNQLCVC